MIEGEDVGQLARLFGALGSDARIRILQELGEKPLCVGALAMRLEMTQSAISQHLTVLRHAGLVESDKRGSFVHYSLAENARERCSIALNAVMRPPERGEVDDDE